MTILGWIFQVTGALFWLCLGLAALFLWVFRAPKRASVIDLRDEREKRETFDAAMKRATSTLDPSPVPPSELSRRIEERSRGLHPTGRGDAS